MENGHLLTPGPSARVGLTQNYKPTQLLKAGGSMGTLGNWIAHMEAKYPDYDIEYVPESAKMSVGPFTLVWIAYTFQTATLLVGGLIGLGLPLKQAIFASILGNVLLSIFAVSTGLIGRREGLGFAMLSRYPFGQKGTVLPSLTTGSVLFGWLVFVYWITGNAVSVLMSTANPNLGTTGFFIGIVLIILGTAIPVAFGFQGPKWVSYVSVPVFIILTLALMQTLLASAGGFAAVAASYVPPSPISVPKAIALAMGAWLVGSMTGSDITRLGKTDSVAYVSPPVGLIVGHSLVLVLASVTAAATGGAFWDPLEASIGLGTTMVLLAVLVYVLSLWSTSAPTCWVSALAFANIFQRPKTGIALLFSVILAPALAILIQFSAGAFVVVDGFINVVTAIGPPIGGILAAEYWILQRGKLPNVRSVQRSWNPIAFATWAIAALLDNWSNRLYIAAGPEVGFPYGIPAVNGFILAFIIYSVLTLAARAMGSRWSYLEQPAPGRAMQG